jgi:cell division topological specificity factor
MDLASLFGGSKKKESSSQVAKERMKFVLVHDRSDIPLETMEKMKNDIIEVISRYVNIDPNDVAIDFNHEGREQRLIADIPIKRGARKN